MSDQWREKMTTLTETARRVFTALVNESPFEQREIAVELGALIDGGTTETSSSPTSSESSAGRFVSTVVAEVSNATILIIGDSTGDNKTSAGDFYPEVTYLFAQWLGEEYPSHTVNLYAWNHGASSYDAADVISTGTGLYDINIYNASRASMPPEYLMGDLFDPAVKDIGKADLVIFNHGHNLAAQSASEPYNVRVPSYAAAIAQTIEYHDTAGVILLGQNPAQNISNTGGNPQKFQQLAISGTASVVNADMTDSYEKLKELVLADDYEEDSLYVDNIHPSTSGAEIQKDSLTKHFGSVSPKMPKGIQYNVTNLLSNADFSSYDSAVPDDWTLVAGTLSKDTTNFETGTYGLNIADSNSSIEQAIDTSLVTTRLRGKRVTLCAKVFIPDDANDQNNHGTLSLVSGAESEISLQNQHGRDAFRWSAVSIVVPDDATDLKAVLIGDGTANSLDATFDRVILFVGTGLADISF